MDGFSIIKNDQTYNKRPSQMHFEDFNKNLDSSEIMKSQAKRHFPQRRSTNINKMQLIAQLASSRNVGQNN